MTEHRCVDGWQEGKVRDCPICSKKRPPRPVKLGDES